MCVWGLVGRPEPRVSNHLHTLPQALASIVHMGESQSADVIVVGAGIIGLAVAWRARQRGMFVTVDRKSVV